MQRTLSSQLKPGKKANIQGWLYNTRDLGGLTFLVINDRAGTIQIVVQNKTEKAKLAGLQIGSVLQITGTPIKTDKTDLGIEVHDPKIKVIIPVKEAPPISYNKQNIDAGLETILDHRALSIRNEKIRAIFKVQASILQAFGESLRKRGFTEFRTPVLMRTPSESGATVFEANYFDGKAYLAQSPQMYKQIMLGAFERVFTVATVFRAEKHSTTRHLMEITHLDAEMAFIESFDDVITEIETTIKDIFEHIVQNNSKELKMWGATLPKLPKGDFPRISVKQAHTIIEERTGKSAKRDELDLDPEDEREIGKWALEKHDSDLIFITNYMKDKNPYTWNSKKDPETSLSTDLICRGLEWLTGTHRIHKHAKLLKTFKKAGLKEDNYRLYLQAFKHGMPPEGGFSFGLERMTQQIFQLKNIREATLFPTDLTRISGERITTQPIKGGGNVLVAIKKLLDSRGMKYSFVEHEEVITGEDAAKIRGTKIEEGVKAIILIGKKTGNNYMAVLPAHLKVDTKTIKDKVGESVELEKPEVILDKFGIEIGGVPPFGHLLGVQTFVDNRMLENEIVAFSCGTRTASVVMKNKDLYAILKDSCEILEAN